MSAQEIEELAAEIGENIYIDIAKWHLFLGDAHLHIPLAERFYSLLDDGAITAAQIKTVLAEITVPIGGGQRQLPLLDLVPTACQATLLDVLETFQDQR